MSEGKVCVIGLGEIGTAIYEDIALLKEHTVFGVDVNPQRIDELKKKGYAVSTTIPLSDVYIIAVYTTDQVLSVLHTISGTNKPLISVESTIDPQRVHELKQLALTKGCDLVIFPHRYNPGDGEHRIFNLHRVLGVDDEQTKQRAFQFYSHFMPNHLITPVPLQIAALSKVLENAHRFIEIALAQTYKESCDVRGIDFRLLQKVANTKWNIDIKEARDGVKGKCLPKDAELLAAYFKDNKVVRLLIDLNKQYIEKQERVH